MTWNLLGAQTKKNRMKKKEEEEVEEGRKRNVLYNSKL